MRLVMITDRPYLPPLQVHRRKTPAIGPSVARCFPDPPVQTLCRKVQEVACGGIFACSIKTMLGRYREASKQEGGRKRFARPGECKGQIFLVVVVVGSSSSCGRHAWPLGRRAIGRCTVRMQLVVSRTT